MEDCGLGRHRGKYWEMDFFARKDIGMLVHALRDCDFDPFGSTQERPCTGTQASANPS